MPDRTVSGSIKIFGSVPTVAHIYEGAVGARLTNAQYTGFTRGNLYVDVRSAHYLNGDIRVQLLRTEAASIPTRAAINPDSRERL